MTARSSRSRAAAGTPVRSALAVRLQHRDDHLPQPLVRFSDDGHRADPGQRAQRGLDVLGEHGVCRRW